MIYFPKTYGTCNGANKAISLAYKLKNENKDKKIYIYKELLHNKYVINELKDNGIHCIDDLSILNENDILIIRAHGETKETFEYLEQHGIEYYDATCVNVKKVHEIVIDKYNEGYKIIIVGKSNHPEVIGTNSWCNNEAIIIENKESFEDLNIEYNYYVVAQTTISEDLFNSLISYMKKNNYNFDYKNTICSYQKMIHITSLSMIKDMDIMFVIGGKHSSNTKELYNLCHEVKRTYHFDNLIEFYEFIKKEDISLSTKIGITAGASTPHNQIREYANLLEFVLYYKNKLKEFSKEINKYNKTLINNSDNKIVIDAVNKFINMNSDGKFLRGCLIDLGYKLNKSDDYATTLAIAYETFQTSILIHDDIIDNAVLRRGKETISETYKKEFSNYKHNDNIHNNLSLCIGDLGFFLTNELIIKKYKNDKNFAKILSYYNNIVINTIKGEILDVYLPFKEKYDSNNKLEENDILEIYRLKTSWYSIVGPFVLGMILGNASAKSIKEMESILENIGISFQIKDDILGIFSSKDVLGKSVYSDIEEFKQTILYSYIKINKPEYFNKLINLYGKENITEDEAKEVQNIIIESGSLEYATNLMNKLFKESRDRINNLDITEYVKNILLGFITYLEIRKK